ncbi:hypothetical protein, partial [Simplicispira metamorpha]|uniref:hypothetical protein n=1 Tax=Simplicispira metamorpha TaxID=80881 RepID=UPI0019D4AA34
MASTRVAEQCQPEIIPIPESVALLAGFSSAPWAQARAGSQSAAAPIIFSSFAMESSLSKQKL